MTSDRANHNNQNHTVSTRIPIDSSYYALLGLHPSASPVEIRRAYRELSKRYHPDTTELPTAIATSKFQQLNEAYATLSNPERRLAYDSKIGYSRINVIQPPPNLDRPSHKTQTSSSAYLDPRDRPLDAGEIFALFLLILTFIGCLVLAIAIGLSRGEFTIQPAAKENQPVKQQIQSQTPINSESILIYNEVVVASAALPSMEK